jgi:hypothetical protein
MCLLPSFWPEEEGERLVSEAVVEPEVVHWMKLESLHG